LAERGAHVIITVATCRKARLSPRRSCRPAIRVEVQELDLTSLESVRAAADELRSRHDSIGLLINNAGVMMTPKATTKDGFELQFGTNHLGHFLLTGLLLPALRRGAPARIVSVSSRGHHMSPVVFDDLHFERRPYDKWQASGSRRRRTCSSPSGSSVAWGFAGCTPMRCTPAASSPSSAGT
jgi:NAD(P)-dependent dehydrogenase (short-subunit alcohol dehydrogenase family)